MTKMTTNNDAICYIMQMTRADIRRKQKQMSHRQRLSKWNALRIIH